MTDTQLACLQAYQDALRLVDIGARDLESAQAQLGSAKMRDATLRAACSDARVAFENAIVVEQPSADAGIRQLVTLTRTADDKDPSTRMYLGIGPGFKMSPVTLDQLKADGWQGLEQMPADVLVTGK